MSKLQALEDIIDWRLCLGCGACKYICSEAKVSLENKTAEGIRPKRVDDDCGDCHDCVTVCPTAQSDFTQLFAGRQPSRFELEWGAIEGIWEGHASDEQIRFEGSSGGALTALSLYCLEVADMAGVLHVGQDPDAPLLNSTRLSTTRAELMRATGSRYSPASACDSLNLVEEAHSPCAVIGKPAEIAGLRNAMGMRPELANKVGISMSFFCAETPPTDATSELLKEFDEDPDQLAALRYRGHGWPGYFTATDKNGESREHWIYQKAWAYLQKFRPWSTQMWPDGAGELADISCGDPWYEEPDGENPGFSIIVARTPAGRRLIEGAIAAGYLVAKPAEQWKLHESQKGLLAKKGSIWGRRLASKLLGVPTSEFTGKGIFTAWRRLSTVAKFKSVAGTVKRIRARGFHQRVTRP